MIEMLFDATRSDVSQLYMYNYEIIYSHADCTIKYLKIKYFP